LQINIILLIAIIILGAFIFAISTFHYNAMPNGKDPYGRHSDNHHYGYDLEYLCQDFLEGYRTSYFLHPNIGTFDTINFSIDFAEVWLKNYSGYGGYVADIA